MSAANVRRRGTGNPGRSVTVPTNIPDGPTVDALGPVWPVTAIPESLPGTVVRSPKTGLIL